VFYLHDKRSSQDYHKNMDAAGFSWWLDNRLIPAFNELYPGKKMILVMDNASYHKQQSTEFYPEGWGPASANKGMNAHVLRRAGAAAISVQRAGEPAPRTFSVPVEEPAEYRSHREDGGKAPSAGAPGTVYGRFPNGPSTEELAKATQDYLKVNCPEALQSMVEVKFAHMGWKIIWTPPYWPKCQPIELIWGGGKQRAGHLYEPNWTLLQTREHLRLGFYGGLNHYEGIWPPIDVPGCVRHAKDEINHWISNDVKYEADGLAGSLQDLRNIERWTESAASCLDIQDMDVKRELPVDNLDLDGGDSGDDAYESDETDTDGGSDDDDN